MIKEELKKFRNKTVNTMIEMGFCASHRGFMYIVDALCLFAEDEEWIHNKIMALYAKLAEERGDGPHCAERDIRWAFGRMEKSGINPEAAQYFRARKGNSEKLAVLYYRLATENQEEK